MAMKSFTRAQFKKGRTRQCLPLPCHLLNDQSLDMSYQDEKNKESKMEKLRHQIPHPLTLGAHPARPHTGQASPWLSRRFSASLPMGTAAAPE